MPLRAEVCRHDHAEVVDDHGDHLHWRCVTCGEEGSWATM